MSESMSSETKVLMRGRVVGADATKSTMEIAGTFTEAPVGARVLLVRDESPLTVTEKLQPLCSDDITRKNLLRPAACMIGGARYLFATNGQGLTAVRSEELAEPSDNAPDCASILSGHPPTLPLDLAAFRAWCAERPGPRTLCERCDKDRLLRCGTCDGSGKVKHHRCGCDKCPVEPLPCSHCSGSGRVACTACGPDRVVSVEHGITLIGLAGRVLNRDLALRYLAPLEGAAKVRPGRDELDAVVIEAENGWAAVMPMRSQAAPDDVYHLVGA